MAGFCQADLVLSFPAKLSNSCGSIVRKIITTVKRLWRLIAPRSFARRKLRLIKNDFKDSELKLFPALITNGSKFVDIGADYGLYTFHALSYAESSIAFESRFEARSAIAKIIKPL